MLACNLKLLLAILNNAHCIMYTFISDVAWFDDEESVWCFLAGGKSGYWGCGHWSIGTISTSQIPFRL